MFGEREGARRGPRGEGHSSEAQAMVFGVRLNGNLTGAQLSRLARLAKREGNNGAKKSDDRGSGRPNAATGRPGIAATPSGVVIATGVGGGSAHAGASRQRPSPAPVPSHVLVRLLVFLLRCFMPVFSLRDS